MNTKCSDGYVFHRWRYQWFMRVGRKFYTCKRCGHEEVVDAPKNA